jgi:ABC-type sugar transport system ATPase subunit
MVYVTHDQIEAMTLADRIVVMNHGRIEQVGKPLELYYSPVDLFVAGFIGSPAMNFFPATVEAVDNGEARIVGDAIDSFVLPAGSLRSGGRLTLGVRPEHLAPAGEGQFATSGVVELVERLGEASYAHVRRADDKMTVSEIRGRRTPTPGETIRLGAPNEEVHVFDEQGRRLNAAA